MDWGHFYTILSQVVIALLVLTMPVAFFIFMVGAQITRARKVADRKKIQ